MTVYAYCAILRNRFVYLLLYLRDTYRNINRSLRVCRWKYFALLPHNPFKLFLIKCKCKRSEQGRFYIHFYQKNLANRLGELKRKHKRKYKRLTFNYRMLYLAHSPCRTVRTRFWSSLKKRGRFLIYLRYRTWKEVCHWSPALNTFQGNIL